MPLCVLIYNIHYLLVTDLEPNVKYLASTTILSTESAYYAKLLGTLNSIKNANSAEICNGTRYFEQVAVPSMHAQLMASNGYVYFESDLTRIQRLLLKSASNNRRHLQLGILGGSVTAGVGANLTWPRRVSSWWNKHFDARLDVRNGAIRACGSQVPSFCFQDYIGTELDWIIYEFQINGAAVVELDRLNRRFEMLARRPAVTQLQIFSSLTPNFIDARGPMTTFAISHGLTSLSVARAVGPIFSLTSSNRSTIFNERQLFYQDRHHFSNVGHNISAFLIIQHLSRVLEYTLDHWDQYKYLINTLDDAEESDERIGPQCLTRFGPKPKSADLFQPIRMTNSEGIEDPKSWTLAEGKDKSTWMTHQINSTIDFRLISTSPGLFGAGYMTSWRLDYADVEISIIQHLQSGIDRTILNTIEHGHRSNLGHTVIDLNLFENCDGVNGIGEFTFRFRTLKPRWMKDNQRPIFEVAGIFHVPPNLILNDKKLRPCHIIHQ
jgi:hypothetical protein